MNAAGGMAAARAVLLCCLLLSNFFTADTLHVETLSTGPLKGIVNKNITLPCKFSGYNANSLDLKNVGIRWLLLNSTGEFEIYMFNGLKGQHLEKRSGSTMLENEIKEGNAALHLTQIQFNEEGRYKCDVFVGASKAEGIFALEVSAQPEASLTPTEVEEVSGAERSISCHMVGFYPQLFKIIWKKEDIVVSKDICTGYPEKNENGSYTVTSILRLKLNKEDHRKVVTCIIEHRSFSSPLHLNATLIVKEHDALFVHQIHFIWPVAICLMVLMCIVLIYFICFKQVAPRITQITGNNELMHMQKANLSCRITGFRPMDSSISVSLKKPQETIDEVVYEKHFTKREPTAISNSDECKIALSLQLGETFSDYVDCKAEIEPNMHRTFSITLNISVIPDVQKLNKTTLFVKVKHRALKNTISEICLLNIVASPILDPIHAVPDIPSTDDTLTLSCRIHSFFPPNLKVKWYINEEEMHGVITSDVISGSDGLYSCTSSISFAPRRKDIGKTFVCSVDHESLKNCRGLIKPKKTTWTLKNLICCPKRIEIICNPVVPEEGKSVTLSCIVQDYYPEDCEVKWFQGFVPIHTATLEDPELHTETDLYRRRSQITFTPTAQDHNTEYSMETTHCSRQLRGTYHMILKGFPIVKNISLDPVDAVYGQPLTLSCQVMGCDPNDITVTWFQKDVPILTGFTTKEPPPKTKDCTSRCHQLQFTPTAAHYNQVFICNVKHINLPQPILKQMYLPLKKIPPVVSEITVTPAEPEVDKTLCMKINVSNFSPKEIQIKWYKGWMDIPKATVTWKDPKSGENNLYVATSTAEISPTQTDNGIVIRCEVQHSATKTVLEKKIILNLKGLWTSTHKQNVKNLPKGSTSFPNSGIEKKNQKEEKSSDIECLTSDPKAGDAVCLKCFVAGCCAGDACISWSKGMFPINDNCVQNLDCDDGSGCISTVILQTQPEDKQCEIRCEVMVDYIKTEKIYLLKLN